MYVSMQGQSGHDPLFFRKRGVCKNSRGEICALASTIVLMYIGYSWAELEDETDAETVSHCVFTGPFC